MTAQLPRRLDVTHGGEGNQRSVVLRHRRQRTASCRGKLNVPTVEHTRSLPCTTRARIVYSLVGSWYGRDCTGGRDVLVHKRKITSAFAQQMLGQGCPSPSFCVQLNPPYVDHHNLSRNIASDSTSHADLAPMKKLMREGPLHAQPTHRQIFSRVAAKVCAMTAAMPQHDR